MGIEITTGPIDVTIDGTTILFQGDPTASTAWDALMEIEVSYTDPEKRDKAKADLTDAFAELSHTPEDAELFRKLDLGVATLRKIAHAYAAAVTGFPTEPPKSSTKRSTKTSTT